MSVKKYREDFRYIYVYLPLCKYSVTTKSLIFQPDEEEDEFKFVPDLMKRDLEAEIVDVQEKYKQK